jgi:glycosyltransferase involved in cell wall biosynthesis
MGINMGEFRETNLTLAEIVGKTGITHPNVGPYEDVSVLIVAWNESERIGPLMELLKPWFERFVVCVQESTDDTLDIARSIANRDTDTVLTDRHHGHGDASFPLMVGNTKTDWCFVVSCDEWPEEVLSSIWSAIALAQLDPHTNEAVWFLFASSIEGIEIAEQNAHLRLFQRRVGWPATLHSRPMTDKGILWPFGVIRHDRSLGEMVEDYMRYLEVGKGNPGWDRHNLMMIREACKAVANHYGWDYVTRYPWWPEAKRLAFSGEE